MMHDAETALRCDQNAMPAMGLGSGLGTASLSSNRDFSEVAPLTLRRTVSYPPMDETQKVSGLVQRQCVHGEEIFTNPPVQACASPLAMRRGMSL